MTQEKKTLITKQRFERVIVRRRKSLNNLLCTVCDAQSAMLSIEESSAVCQIGIRAIARLVENMEIHFVELPSGSLLVCVESLLAAMRKQ